jgi:hypothetical protein
LLLSFFVSKLPAGEQQRGMSDSPRETTVGGAESREGRPRGGPSYKRFQPDLLVNII